MVESMTGFGRGTASVEGIDVTVEVRSVNSRYVEVSVRSPRELAPFEAEIQKRARDLLGRGKISINVQVDRQAGTLPLAIDEGAARSYAALLERLRMLAGIEQPLQIEHLLHFREVFVDEQRVDIEAAVLWSATREALVTALADCRTMRLREGEALAIDLLGGIDSIERELNHVEESAPARVAAAREALQTRLAELIGDESRINPDRLEMEVALLADRLDINEECVRLRSHFTQFREAIGGDEPAGRRLNFLSQELNREINTISSKASDAAIAHRAVAMKEDLEKIREQVQNVA